MPSEITVNPKRKTAMLDSIASVINTGAGVVSAANTVSGIIDKIPTTASRFAAEAENVMPEKLPAVQEVAPDPMNHGPAMMRRNKMGFYGRVS